MLMSAPRQDALDPQVEEAEKDEQEDDAQHDDEHADERQPDARVGRSVMMSRKF